MKVLTAFKFTLLTIAVSTAFASSVASILSDIQTISGHITTLDKAITAFPDSGGSFSSAMAIHNDVDTLITAIDKGTTDVNDTPIPLSPAAGTAILTAIQAIEPRILALLTHVVAKQPAFQGIPLFGFIVDPTVRQDLVNAESSTSQLEDALIGVASDDQMDAANSIKTAVDAAFASAIAAYS